MSIESVYRGMAQRLCGTSQDIVHGVQQMIATGLPCTISAGQLSRPDAA
jgi:hypothetical protein